jgi:hypothetical protein
MRFDDDAPRPTPDLAPETSRSRRRASRPWSNPGAGAGEPGVAPPSLPARPRPPATPPILPPLGALEPPAPGADLTPVLSQLTALQAQVTALQAAVAEPQTLDAALVTGEELTAAIEGLGTALGGGMATLLTEHRNLLARDVTQTADRILEELGVRLRAATAQTVDAVEERVRHVVAKALNEMSEQFELRLDKVQGDVAGLRAVMLDLPDQSAITDRLDQLSDAVAETAKARTDGRSGPAVAAAIERSVSGPLERVEEELHAIVDVVRELLDERLPEDLAGAVVGGGSGTGIDAASLSALTEEMRALRRRISLRSAAEPEPDLEPEPRWADSSILDEGDEEEGDELDDAEDDDEAIAVPIEPEPAPAKPARRSAKAPAKRAAPKAAVASAKAPQRGRRSRRISD